MLANMQKPSVKDIIQECGGPPKIASESRAHEHSISEKGVYSWHRIGIPQKHWPVVMALSGRDERQIFAANQALTATGNDARAACEAPLRVA